MGLLDIFRKPKKNSKHHYAFAHHALRQVAFAEPVRIFSILVSNARIKLFDDLLRNLDTYINETERRNFSGSDIRFTALAIGNRPCAILQMPLTTNPAEAYFIAIVCRVPMERLSSHLDSATAETLIDYYTLERPVAITPEQQSVLCAWTRDGCHKNLGKGPKPTIEQFGAFLAQRIQKNDRNA